MSETQSTLDKTVSYFEERRKEWEVNRRIGVRRTYTLVLSPGRLTTLVFFDIVQGPDERFDTGHCTRV